MMKKLFAPESDLYINLDFLRILASMAIVIFHYKTAFSGDGPLISYLGSSSNLSLFVDLFFAISGFIIASFYADRLTTPQATGDFLKKRFARLYPLHLATLAFYVLIGILFMLSLVQVDNPERYDFSCLAPHLLLLHGIEGCPKEAFNYVSWSISAEMTMYLLFPGMALLFRNRLKLQIAAVVLLFVGLSLLSSEWVKWTHTGGALRALPSFILGMSFYALRDRIAAVPRCREWMLACLALFFITYPVAPPLLSVLILYAVVFFAVGADLNKQHYPPVYWLSGLGKLTYSIYMLHTLTYTVVVTVVGGRMLGLSGEGLNYWIGFAILLNIPLGFLSYYLFETPCRKWISKWSWKGRQGIPVASS